MIRESLTFLVIDGYKQSSRELMSSNGLIAASELYKRTLHSIAPNAEIDIVTPADLHATWPVGAKLDKYHGVTMTGSDLSVLDAQDPSIRSQIELQREVFKRGIPSFGSCWAAQVGTVAAGGEVRVNPKGREMGFARKVKLTDQGLNHPMYEGKNPVFDTFASHEDEISVPPPNAQILSGNAVSEVQALEITHDKGTMWTVQYHPEFDAKYMADLIRCRQSRLIAMGFFADEDEVAKYADRLDAVHENPQSKHDAWQLGIDSDILDANFRQLEIRNWIQHLVLPEKNR